MTLSFNISPYFDDFSSEKNFYKVLFQPSRPVQTRELNQLQSILQDQVSKFGSHIFKNGSMVVPGHVFYDNKVTFIKLNPLYNTVSANVVIPNLIGKTITNTVGVQALVVHAEVSTDTDAPVIFVKYTSGANDSGNIVTEFVSDDILSDIDNPGSAVSVAQGVDYTGTGSIVTINNGIYFFNGYFVYVPKQSIVVEKFGINGTWNIVLRLNETVVTENEDPTLFDNALGYPNYSAPGAHRYKIDPILEKQDPSETNNTNDDGSLKYINVLEIKNGEIVYELKRTMYSELEKIFARRTYEESGNYEVNPFQVIAKEYRSNDRGSWVTATPYLVGDVVESDGYSWRALNTGTSGGIAPSTNSDTVWKVTDGSVNWVVVNEPVSTNNGVYNIESTLIDDHIEASNKMVYEVSPGKAYITGYEVEKQSYSNIETTKAVEFEYKSSESLLGMCGSFITVTGVTGIPNINEGELIDIFGPPTTLPLPSRQATATYTVGAGGTITSVTITDPGFGYSRSTDVVITAPGGTGAVFRAQVMTTSEISEIKVLNGGTGYTAGSLDSGISSPPDPRQKIGTLRVKSIDWDKTSAAPGSSLARYLLNVFDIKMDKGYSFDIHAWGLKGTGVSDPFVADLVKKSFPISGISFTEGTRIVDGIGTSFINTLQKGQVLRIGNTYNMVSDSGFSDVTFNTTHNINAPTSSNTTIYAYYNEVKSTGSNFLYLPKGYVRSIRQSDDYNWDIAYTTRRKVTATSNGSGEINVNLTVPGEVFADTTKTGNYWVVQKSTGGFLTPSSISKINNNTTLVITGLSASTDYEVIVSVEKSGLAAKEKVKTIETGSITLTTAIDLTKTEISLGKADVFNIIRIIQNGVDLTKSFELDNGQTPFYYGISKLVRKPGITPPNTTDPMTIVFEYFKHSAGDYFSVNSYNELPWASLLSLHRDTLDFRPRINDAGTGFTGTGASNSESVVLDSNVTFSYSYYLPRRDVVTINGMGELAVLNGASSFQLQTPIQDSDSMRIADATLTPGDNIISSNTVSIIKHKHKRYTMADIGRLENRINNLEYYTELSMLDRESLEQTVVDRNGLDRFKSGLLVDEFKNQGVADLSHPDYLATHDIQKKELSAFVSQYHQELRELDVNDVQRTNHNYKITGQTITLPYTEEVIIGNTVVASRTENVNPFSVITFDGQAELQPNADTWVARNVAPGVVTTGQINLFDSMNAALEASGALGSVLTNRQTLGISSSAVYVPQSYISVYSSGYKTQAEAEADLPRIQAMYPNTNLSISGVKGRSGLSIGHTWTGSRLDGFNETTTYLDTYNTTISVPSTTAVDLGTQFTGTEIATWMRPRPVMYSVTGLKPNTSYKTTFNDIPLTMFQSIDILINHDSTNIGKVYDFRTSTKSQIGNEQDYREFPWLQLSTHTDQRGAELVPLDNGSVVFVKSSFSAMKTAIVIEKISISSTQTLLKCAYINNSNQNNFPSSGTLYTNSPNQNINSGADLNIGSIVSVTRNTAKYGEITTDGLGNASGYFVIPCFTQGTKIKTGSTEFKVIEQ